MKATAPPCRRRGDHRHRLTWVRPGAPARARRGEMTDRCNSLLLWSTAAWALLTGRDPLLDGALLDWPGARAYLDAHAAEHTGGLARNALRLVERQTTRH